MSEALPGYAVLPLNRGAVCKLDWDDFIVVSEHSWHLKSKTAAPGRYYVQRTIQLGSGRGARKSTLALHRVLLNAGPGDIVDHRNGDTLDNRRANLRITDARGNAMNVRGKNLKAGKFQGVYQNKRTGRWQAAISAGPVRPNGKRARVHLGCFSTPEEAAKAYDAAAREHFGTFASLNFPEVADV